MTDVLVVAEPQSGRLARWARATDWPLVILALAVIPVVVLEDQSPSASVRTAALVANWLIWAAFVGDFLLRWSVVRFQPRYLRQAWLDLLIVVLTIPVTADVLRGFLALRGVRVLRLLRLVRVGGVALLTFRRYREGLAKRQFHYVCAIAVVVIGLGALGLYLLEGDQNPSVGSLGDALWWAVVTATTVGYGDISPTTLEGRLIAAVLMLVGIGVIGIFTASVASQMFANDEGVTNDHLAARMDRLEQLLLEVRAEVVAQKSHSVSGDEAAHRQGPH